MIKPIERKEIVKTKKIIGSELAKMQHAYYDASVLEYFEEDDTLQLYQERFDFLKEPIINYASHSSIIGIRHTDIVSFTAVLGQQLEKLFQLLGVQDFYLISHLKLDFFGNRCITHKPLKRAYDKLQKILGQKSFKEGLSFELKDVRELIDIVFWMTRCDPGVSEYILFFDHQETFQLQVCKYGHIHFTSFEKPLLPMEKIVKLGWICIEGQEKDSFSTDGKISGRKLKT